MTECTETVTQLLIRTEELNPYRDMRYVLIHMSGCVCKRSKWLPCISVCTCILLEHVHAYLVWASKLLLSPK